MISFSAVSKNYAENHAVDSFTLDMPSRKITVLMGLSGSGKTTLLRMINKMVEPSSGTITIDGNDIQELDSVKLRRSIGYVLQEVGLLPHKSVLENVSLIAKISGQTDKDAKDNAASDAQTRWD